MTTETLSDELVAKLYRDMAFLAAEIAVDRCRTRVLMQLVKDRLGIDEAELDAMLRDEVGDHLEDFVRRITFPMSAPDVVDVATGGGCGGSCG
jgi:hypothetical protein